MDNKEVSELMKVLSDDYCDTLGDEQGQWCSLDCDKCRAERVIEAGYRKADEMRKETAKEILDKLLTIMPHGYEQVKAFVKTREEEYGVEVFE